MLGQRPHAEPEGRMLSQRGSAVQKEEYFGKIASLIKGA